MPARTPARCGQGAGRRLVLLAAASVIPKVAVAQNDRPAARAFEPFVAIGSAAEDRLRLAQLRGRATTDGWLLRTAAALSDRPAPVTGALWPWTRCALAWEPVLPQLDVTWNSRIPVETNSGGVWPGRGLSLAVAGGVRGRCGRWRFQIAPEVWYTANQPFPLITSGAADRSAFANPFHSYANWSVDMPVRFGTSPIVAVQPGQSVIEYQALGLGFGIGSESQWWGPSIRNALLISNHAAGVPALHIRTTRPLRTPVGRLESRVFGGMLAETPFFRTAEHLDRRSLAGLIITLRTAVDTGLTVGIARVVYRDIGALRWLPARMLDPVLRWGPGGDVRRYSYEPGEQLSELFARWVFPESGFEAWAEWARVVPPLSLRDLLVAPQQHQGYTVGLQWSAPVDAKFGGWRVQSEITSLEQLMDSRTTPPASFYTSGVVPAGYTQRGRVIGAMIGPGSSSQFLLIDRRFDSFSVGLDGGRIRWDNEAYYFAPTGLGVWAHDVSLWGGLRASAQTRWGDVVANLELEHRLNYLFQSATSGYTPDGTFDVHNVSFRVSFQPTPRLIAPRSPAPPR